MKCRWLLRDTLFLLPMFGITWVFGLLAFNENLSVFAWLFVFFNTTQVCELTVYI